MSDIMLMDAVRAVELRQRTDTAAEELERDAQALIVPMAEAASLLGAPVPDVPGNVRSAAAELRDLSEDLTRRTALVLAGGSEMNEGLGALERIRKHFTMIESRGDPQRADGLLSRRDLVWASHSSDPEVAEAAEWMLSHDGFFDRVETAKHNDDYLKNPYSGEFAFDPEDRDGLMSLDDIDSFVDKATAWAQIMPHVATVDTVKTYTADGFLSREDFEAFLADYNLTDAEMDAVRQVLDDGAYHTHDSAIGFGTLLDVMSFVPVVGDVIDGARAIYYTLHRDYETAALFALGIVPLPGLTGSGVRGAKKMVEHVVDVARKSGAKAAVKEGTRLTVKGTAANYAAYESTRQVSGAFDRTVELDESIEYVVEDVLGEHMQERFGTRLDPRLRKLLGERLEQTLEENLEADNRRWLSDANQVISRRMAEHAANEPILRGLTKP